MKLDRALEQHIAVFGESGSGKTVMLSAFYGAAQEPQFLQKSRFHIIADNSTQGRRLHQNYVGMRDSSRVPDSTRFESAAYSFTVKLKDHERKAAKASPFEALRLVWHDYPGEWFEQEVSGPEEARRRLETFRSLLSSDVALLVVDGQRLLDNSGREERYLKVLLAGLRNSLLSLKDELLTNGQPLVEFPRIWMIALSKADLLPNWDVFKFRDTVIGKAGDDIEQLHEVLAGLVVSSDALSVGDDFLLLSSAAFKDGQIEVTTRVGLDLVLPIAATLPLERHVSWAQKQQLPAKVLENLLGGVKVVAPLLLGAAAKWNPVAAVLGFVGAAAADRHLDTVVKLAGDKLREVNAEAEAKQNYLTAALTQFRIDLEDGERDHLLFRSL